MNHDEAAQWIFDLPSGRLPADLETPVSGHVRECVTCRRMLEIFDSVAAACKHPDAELLVRYAVDAVSLDQAERESLDSHCLQCASCAREVQAVREAEHELAAVGATDAHANLASFPQRPPAVRWRRMSFAAMGTAAMLLVAFGYVALWTLPRSQDRIDNLQRGLAALQSGATGQAVSLPLFSGALRDGASQTTVTIPQGRATVPLAVAPSLPRSTGATARHRFEILDADEESVFSLELTAAEIRNLTRDSDAMALLVPGTAVSDGAHRLTLTDLDQDVILLDRSFRFVREEKQP